MPDSTTSFEEVVHHVENSGILKDQEHLRRNIEFMNLVFRAGKIVKNADDYHGSVMPYVYQVDGAQISFLPHWAKYEYKDVHFPPALSVEELQEQIHSIRDFYNDPRNPRNFFNLLQCLKKYSGSFKTEIVTKTTRRVVTDIDEALRHGAIHL